MAELHHANHSIDHLLRMLDASDTADYHLGQVLDLTKFCYSRESWLDLTFS